MTSETRRAADAAGEATLELFRENDGYSEFLWDRLSALEGKSFGGRVLEVGCGIGNLTAILLRAPAVTFLQAIDIDPAYVERVRDEIRDPRLSVAAARAEEYRPEEALASFDFIVATNVLEHIEDHAGALSSFRRLLAPGGRVLLLVPAHPRLYSRLDRNLSHFRRYTPEGLHDVARRSGLEVLRLRHFNPLAAIGWWLNGKVLRRGMLPAGQLAMYTRFGIPLSRLADRWNPIPFGVSLIASLGDVSGLAAGSLIA